MVISNILVRTPAIHTRRQGLLVVPFIFFNAFCAAANPPVPTDIMRSMLSDMSTWKDVPAIQFEATIDVSFDPKFVSLNNTPNVRHADNRIDYIKGVFTDQRFRVESKSQYNDKTYSGTAIATFDGANTFYLDGEDSSRLNIKKGLKREMPGRMEVGNPFLLPFSFLTSSIVQRKLAVVTLQDVQSLTDTSLDSFDFELAQKEKQPIADGTTFVTTLKDGGKYFVTFGSKQLRIPTFIQKKDPAGRDAFTIAATEFAKLDVNGKSVSYPSSTVVTFYLLGMKAFIYKIHLSQVKIVPAPGTEMFALDPASASDIWDEDAQVLIDIPK